MSLLGQISSVQLGNVRTLSTQVSRRVKDSTFVRWKGEFEKPRHALGNRHRNPVVRLSDKLLQLFARPFRAISRIEITVRIRRY